jgi:internalin A
MTELHSIYQRSLGEKEDFLRRIIPLVLDDARFGTWRDRLVYTKHWRTEFEEMEQHFKDLASQTSGSTRRCRNGTTGSAICSLM